MRVQSVVQVRRAKQRNAAAIALLIRQSFREHEPAYTPEAFDLATPRKHEIEKRIKELAKLVAIHGNEIVGTISAHSQARHCRSGAWRCTRACEARELG